MTTLSEFTWSATSRAIFASAKPTERRRQRRHEMESQGVIAQRWDERHGRGEELGNVIDLSSGGVRIRTSQGDIRPDQQIRLRLELPAFAGISPFVDTSGERLRPKTSWVGWMAVSRVQQVSDDQFEVAGRLMDMQELDRGMLSLYLSTQPMAA
jgi:hypothetical protein